MKDHFYQKTMIAIPLPIHERINQRHKIFKILNFVTTDWQDLKDPKNIYGRSELGFNKTSRNQFKKRGIAMNYQTGIYPMKRWGSNDNVYKWQNLPRTLKSLFFFGILTLTSCFSDIKTFRDNDSKWKEHWDKMEEARYPVKKYLPGSIYVFEVDSCEYIIYNGSREGGIIHKENCKNPIHKH